LPELDATSGSAPNEWLTSLPAQIAISKFVDGLLLYRLESCLPCATRARWMIALVKPPQPLMNLMDEQDGNSGYVRIDETPMQVLKSHSKMSRVLAPARSSSDGGRQHGNSDGGPAICNSKFNCMRRSNRSTRSCRM